MALAVVIAWLGALVGINIGSDSGSSSVDEDAAGLSSIVLTEEGLVVTHEGG